MIGENALHERLESLLRQALLNSYKIGLNTTSSKFYNLKKQIGLATLNLSFVHFKKLMKIQFLKFGKT